MSAGQDWQPVRTVRLSLPATDLQTLTDLASISLSGTNMNKKQKQQERDQPGFEEILQDEVQQGFFVLKKASM